MLLVSILVACVCAAVLLVKTSGKKKLTPSNPTKGMSSVGKHLYKEYMGLPEDSRPNYDIVAVIRGLDEATSHDVQGRKDHYDENYYMRSKGYDANLWSYEFSWSPTRRGTGYDRCASTHSRNGCEFHAYYDIYVEICKLKKQLAAKERALNSVLSERKVAAAQELLDALRAEQLIQYDVTKELER